MSFLQLIIHHKSFLFHSLLFLLRCQIHIESAKCEEEQDQLKSAILQLIKVLVIPRTVEPNRIPMMEHFYENSSGHLALSVFLDYPEMYFQDFIKTHFFRYFLQILKFGPENFE